MGLEVAPEILEAASVDISTIGSMVSDANVAAAAATTGVVAAGADEVSAAITALFNSHGQVYQELAAQAARFHQQFGVWLRNSAALYEEAEQTIQQTLRDDITQVEQLVVPPQTLNPVPPLVPTNSPVGLVMGGTSNAFTPSILQPIKTLYNLPTTTSLLYTPEQFWPVTPQLGGLTLNQSITQGTGLLNQAIAAQWAAGNHVTVWGTSQSAVIETEEIRNLMAAGSPNTGRLNFIITGDPNNPNGGLIERFTGAYIPLVDASANGATPPNSPYPVSIYTNQYDAAANFPNYPLNALSDVNALYGSLVTGTHDYGINPAHPFPSTPIQLATSPGYTGNTTYYESLTQNLPLVQPLRGIPVVGNAFADLLQPDLRVLVDMGYATGDYANIPTPAQLFEIPDPFTILPDLAAGAVQGVQAFGVDVALLPQSMFPTAYPFVPTVDPGLNFPTPQPSVTALSLLSGFEGDLFGH